MIGNYYSQYKQPGDGLLVVKGRAQGTRYDKPEKEQTTNCAAQKGTNILKDNVPNHRRDYSGSKPGSAGAGASSRPAALVIDDMTPPEAHIRPEMFISCNCMLG